MNYVRLTTRVWVLEGSLDGADARLSGARKEAKDAHHKRRLKARLY